MDDTIGYVVWRWERKDSLPKVWGDETYTSIRDAWEVAVSLNAGSRSEVNGPHYGVGQISVIRQDD